MCGVTFPQQIPYIVSYHDFVPPPLIALFHHLDVLVKPFTMLFACIPQVIPKEIQLRMQKCNLRTCGYQTFHNFQSNLTPPLHSRLFDDFQEILPQSFQSLPSISLQSKHLFLQLFSGQHSSYLWPHKYTTFNFCFRYALEHLSNMAKTTACRFQSPNKLLGQSDFDMQWRKYNFAPFIKR